MNSEITVLTLAPKIENCGIKTIFNIALTTAPIPNAHKIILT